MKKLSMLKDGSTFRITNRKNSATYRLNRKSKGKAWFSSVSSERTYSRPLSKKVYV